MSEDLRVLSDSVTRIEAKLDSHQEILASQNREMNKISDAIVTIARLDEHLLRFREEDREAKQRIWANIEAHAVRLRHVEETTATIKDTRNVGIAFLVAVTGAVVALLVNLFKSPPS